MKLRNHSQRSIFLLTAFGIYALDQASKLWAVQSLRFGEDLTVVRGFLQFAYAENSGIAFGQLQNGGALGRWFFVALALAAAVVVVIYFFRTLPGDTRVLASCSFLLAGIMGNLTDRLRLGFVVDFIAAHAGIYHWPTFNVADASICAGALVLAWDIFSEGKRQKAVAERTGGPADAASDA